MDRWEKLKILSNFLASVGVPLVIGLVGLLYSDAIKAREVQGKFVEIAVDILREDPSDQKRSVR